MAITFEGVNSQNLGALSVTLPRRNPNSVMVNICFVFMNHPSKVGPGAWSLNPGTGNWTVAGVNTYETLTVFTIVATGLGATNDAVLSWTNTQAGGRAYSTGYLNAATTQPIIIKPFPMPQFTSRPIVGPVAMLSPLNWLLLIATAAPGEGTPADFADAASRVATTVNAINIVINDIVPNTPNNSNPYSTRGNWQGPPEWMLALGVVLRDPASPLPKSTSFFNLNDWI